MNTLEVEFCILCGHDESDGVQSIMFRTQVLSTIFSALNDPRYPTPNLRKLCLFNLQNMNPTDLIHSSNFLCVLQRLSALDLDIVTEPSGESEEWQKPDFHNFLVDLPSIWLKPACENLTDLTLSMDVHWGYFPPVDFRSVHFPKLKRLGLQLFTFTHDWQIEWIISHGASLEELDLRDSVIIRRVWTYGLLDMENYHLAPRSDQTNTQFWQYDGRWKDYFFRIEEGLPKLTSFRFVAEEPEVVAYSRRWMFLLGSKYMELDRREEDQYWVPLKDDNYSHGQRTHALDNALRNMVLEDKLAHKHLMTTLAKR
ncbi:hypothetical protein F5884DRAFT_494802 [Xylogone sp. PMI_703]|nr:hypothetical protein F5884DRAFT_494802 [Xylogone sp. PMI_703]